MPGSSTGQGLWTAFAGLFLYPDLQTFACLRTETFDPLALDQQLEFPIPLLDTLEFELEFSTAETGLLELEIEFYAPNRSVRR